MCKAFTLIELLIVVAIIAILAAIAVPNFLEAQTRSKVSRTTADMRSLATALESYTVDHNKPMTTWCRAGALSGRSAIFSSNTATDCVSCRFIRLTTPISYMNSIPPEIFVGKGGEALTMDATVTFSYDTFDYFDHTFETSGNKKRYALTSGATWRIASAGPDKIQAYGGAATDETRKAAYGVDYDPTNGTISRGDIVRISGAAGSPGASGIKPAIDRVSRTYNVTGI